MEDEVTSSTNSGIEIRKDCILHFKYLLLFIKDLKKDLGTENNMVQSIIEDIMMHLIDLLLFVGPISDLPPYVTTASSPHGNDVRIFYCHFSSLMKNIID